MAAQDKQMGKDDLQSFLNQQFPKSNEVNNLLEQITASKNAMEKAMGEEIPSFYGTVSRYISQHTVNGISDWINSNGQVDVAQVHRAALTARKVYEVQKRQEQQEEQDRQKKAHFRNEVEDIEQQKADEKFKQFDFNNLTVESVKDILPDFLALLHSKSVPVENKKKISDIICKTMGVDEFHQVVIEAKADPSILQKAEVQSIIASHPERDKYFDEKGWLKREADIYADNMANALNMIFKLKPEERTEANIRGILKEQGLDSDVEKGCCDAREIFENVKDENFQEIVSQINKQKNDKIKISQADIEQMSENGQKAWQEAQKNIQDKMESQDIHKVDKIIEVASGIEIKETAEVSQDDMEDFFSGLFEGAIDLAEQAEEMGFPMQEGEGYTTFFEPSDQELAYEKMQAEQGAGLRDSAVVGEPEVAELGQDGAEPIQGAEEIGGAGVTQGEAEAIIQEPMQGEREDTAREAVAAGALGVIGQLQNAAREEPNDYTQGQDEAYKAPTLDNLDDNKKGGIFGLFAGIKKFVQDRFAKKPEQKRLNASMEQRTDENGWTVTTYDGNGKDLMPRGTGLRNAMVRFAENTVGRLGKLAASNQRSSEPINNPYIVPTNVQKREDKEQTQDKTNQWVVDKSRLSPLQHNTQKKNEQQKGDGER